MINLLNQKRKKKRQDLSYSVNRMCLGDIQRRRGTRGRCAFPIRKSCKYVNTRQRLFYIPGRILLFFLLLLVIQMLVNIRCLKDPLFNHVLASVFVKNFVKLIHVSFCQWPSLRQCGAFQQWLAIYGWLRIQNCRQRIKLVIRLDPFIAEMRSVGYLTNRLLHGLHKLNCHIRRLHVMLLIDSVLKVLRMDRLLLGLS